MSRKTITMRVRHANTMEHKVELTLKWLCNWETEQTVLCNKLPLAIDIHDFDELCIINGQLREITNKKFTALYNILPELGISEQAQDGGQIYSWGKYQTGLIAIMGRHIAHLEWGEIRSVTEKLIAANKTSFKGVKHIILQHQKQDTPAPEVINKPAAEPTRKPVTVHEIIDIYNRKGSLKETAIMCGVNWQKVRKILITEGLYENDISIKINLMRQQGFTLDEIAQGLKMSKTAINSYLPYEKGIYNIDSSSENTLRIRKHREKPTDK